MRVNVYVGAMVTDQGIIQGAAREAIVCRRALDESIEIAADVMVKHAAPLGGLTLESCARDAWHRGRADRLIISGDGTGCPTRPDDVARVRAAVPQAVIWVGSGVTPDNVGAFVGADGFIVGTFLHEQGDINAPVDVDRVRQMVAAMGG